MKRRAEKRKFLSVVGLGGQVLDEVSCQSDVFIFFLKRIEITFFKCILVSLEVLRFGGLKVVVKVFFLISSEVSKSMFIDLSSLFLTSFYQKTQNGFSGVIRNFEEFVLFFEV